MKLLVIAGAGTSIELGVPVMSGLAEEFLEHARQWNVEPELVGQLLGDKQDIEHLLEELDRICSAKDALAALGQAADLGRFDGIRAEVEWFIQHAAERVVPREAHLMWGALLRAVRNVEVTIVTTNYDRAVELAANHEGIHLHDGFQGFGHNDLAAWQGFSAGMAGVALVKIHGSTDWYADHASGKPIKLRHPMPLFGRALIRLSDTTELGSALILPSREKLLTRDPYPRLSQAFLNAADACDFAVVVGSSLRDPHLRGPVESIASRVPVFLVNPEQVACGGAYAFPIVQCASAFLASTLPTALVSDDPVASLKKATGGEGGTSNGTLRSLKWALDEDAPRARRCQAIEQLYEEGVTLDHKWIAPLVSGSDATVARYALGLISQSPDKVSLLDLAAQAPHASTNAAYEEDLHLLQELVGKPGHTAPATDRIEAG